MTESIEDNQDDFMQASAESWSAEEVAQPQPIPAAETNRWGSPQPEQPQVPPVEPVHTVSSEPVQPPRKKESFPVWAIVLIVLLVLCLCVLLPVLIFFTVSRGIFNSLDTSSYLPFLFM
jgi:hypothetical protein